MSEPHIDPPDAYNGARPEQSAAGSGDPAAPQWWTLALPWTLPNRVLRPRGVYPAASDRLERLEFWRGWATLAVLLIIVINADPRRLLSYPGHVVFETFGAMVWTVIVVTLLVLVSLAIAVPSSGVPALRALLRPVWRMAFVAGSIAALLASGLVWYRDGLIGSMVVELDPRDGFFTIVGVFVGMAIVQIWILLFLMTCVYQIAKHQLAISDAHPLLGPLATLAVTWTLALGGLVTSYTGEIPLLFPAPPDFVPASPLTEAVTWCSLVALTVLCVLQFRVTLKSWSLRHGPWR